MIEKTSRLIDLQAQLARQRAEQTPFDPARSRLQGELREAEGELKQADRECAAARAKSAEAVAQNALAGDALDLDAPGDQDLELARVAAQRRVDVLQKALAHLETTASEKQREIRATEAEIDAAVSAILCSALEAQAAKVDALRVQYLAEGAVLREWAPNDIHARIDARRTVSAAAQSTVDSLPRVDDLNTPLHVLRGLSAAPRDRWIEARAQLLSSDDGPVPEAHEAA